MPSPLPKGEDVFTDGPQPTALPKGEDVFSDDADADTLKQFGQHLAATVNPVPAIKAAATPKTDPSQFPEVSIPEKLGDSFQKSYESAKSGDYLTALRHLLLAGSPLENTADLYQQGKPYAASGDVAGTAINFLAPEAIGKLIEPGMGGAAANLYRRALKPAGAIEDQNRAVQSGLSQGLPVDASSVGPAGENLGSLANQVASKIPSDQLIPGSTGRAVAASRDVEDAHSFLTEKQSNIDDVLASRQQLLDRLSKVPGGAVRDMKAGEMQDAKIGTYARLRNQQGYAPQTPYDENDAAMVKAMNEDLKKNFPEIAPVLDQEGAAAEFYKDLKKTVASSGKSNLLSGTALGGSIGAGAGSIGGTPGVIGGALAGGGLGAAIKIAQSPSIASRIALYLYKGSDGTISPLTARLKAAGYLNQLYNDANEYDKEQQAKNAKP